jgi:hypothetical protein
MRSIKVAAPVICFVLLGAAFAGCPLNVRRALIVNPKSLDFGSNITVLQFEVRANASSRPILPFSATSDNPWIGVTPSTGESTGPEEVVIFTVTLNRSLLPPVDLETGLTPDGTVLVNSPGVVPAEIDILAER